MFTVAIVVRFVAFNVLLSTPAKLIEPPLPMDMLPAEVDIVPVLMILPVEPVKFPVLVEPAIAMLPPTRPVMEGGAEYTMGFVDKMLAFSPERLVATAGAVATAVAFIETKSEAKNTREAIRWFVFIA